MNKQSDDISVLINLTYDPGPCCLLRGDVDHNGLVNPFDALYLVDWLFKMSVRPPCEEEADVNADGSADVLDACYLVNYLWRGGPAPVPCP